MLGPSFRCLFEEIGEQDWLVALRTVTAESHGSAEQLTRGTAALADEALLTVRTFVQGVSRQLALPLQLATEVWFIRWWGTPLTKSVGELSVSRRTELGAGVHQRFAAHQATRLTLA